MADRFTNGRPKTNLDFNEAKDDGVAVISAGPFTEMICTSLQTDNHAG